jgi:hypothetical protein
MFVKSNQVLLIEYNGCSHFYVQRLGIHISNEKSACFIIRKVSLNRRRALLFVGWKPAPLGYYFERRLFNFIRRLNYLLATIAFANTRS